MTMLQSIDIVKLPLSCLSVEEVVAGSIQSEEILQDHLVTTDAAQLGVVTDKEAKKQRQRPEIVWLNHPAAKFELQEHAEVTPMDGILVLL